MADDTKAAQAVLLKGKIDRLREKWEQLDASGSYSVEANNCQRKMRLLERELKELTGEEY